MSATAEGLHSAATRVAGVETLGSWIPDPELERAWQALALAQDNIFGTPDWFAAWGALDRRDRPRALVAYGDDGSVLGILPLVLSQRGPLRVLEYSGACFADVVEPPCVLGWETTVSAAWRAALASSGRRAHAIALPRVDTGRWVSALTAGALTTGFRAVRRSSSDVLPYIELSNGYEAWLGSRSRNLRNNIRSGRRRLEREHEVRFRVSERGTLERDFETLLDLHRRRWAERGQAGAIPTWSEPFHRAFATAASARGWLRLHVLELDGTPAAAWYGWRYGTRTYFYQSGFDPAMAQFGLGALMLVHTIEEAANEGAAVYDMLWGDEAYKARFATGRREATSLLLVRRAHPVGRSLAAAATAVDRARNLPPWLKDPLRRLRGRLESLRQG